MLTFGTPLYTAMGGRDGSLAAALAYSDTIFAGSILVWLFNSLAATIRGSGNMILPVTVMCVGAVMLIPLSPALIFGLGPFPQLGISGGAIAVIVYYAAGTFIFARFLWSGQGVAKPTRHPPAPSRHAIREILKVGAISSVISATTNITIASGTSFAAAFGASAVAGYGTGARLEYLLVPLTFGLGAPLAAIVGTCIGAGQRQRALRSAWIGAAAAGLITETIGVTAAYWPHLWLSLFSEDPAMIVAGTRYLQIVGPYYGFFGAGMALYFASQGAARVFWPLVAGLSRVAVSVGGGWLALQWGSGIDGVYLALALGLAVVGIVNAAAIAIGSWSPSQQCPFSAKIEGAAG